MRHFKYCSPMGVTLGKGSFSFPQGLHSSFGSRGCCQQRTARCYESMYSPATLTAFLSYSGLSTSQTAVCSTDPQPQLFLLDRSSPVTSDLSFKRSGLVSKINGSFNHFFLCHLGNAWNRTGCEYIVVYIVMALIWSSLRPLVTSSIH